MGVPRVVSFHAIDERRCRVVLSDPVPPSDEGVFNSREEAAGHPAAQALFCVRGILALAIHGDHITIAKDSPTPWEALEKPMRYAISTALARVERDAQTRAAAGGTLTDNQMFDLVERIIREQINPSIASHGGMMELLDVQDAVAGVRLRGGCQGCGMASVTLSQGIETTLRQLVPGFAGLRDITDHSAGTNPYFAAQKS